MEALLVLALISFFLLPFVLGIIALVKASVVQSQLNAFKKEVSQQFSDIREGVFASEADMETAQKTADTEGEVEFTKHSTNEENISEPYSESTPLKVSTLGPNQPAPQDKQKKRSTPKSTAKDAFSFEFLMGGKGAAFVGISILVIGISLLVVYAIQHSWIGPGARTVLGLLSGGVLIVLGHIAERKSRKLKVLARALTGGGGSLLFLSVFAAYRLYQLIPAELAFVGLLVAAAAVFALAWVYQAQSVALLGVVGAFAIPILVGDGVGAPEVLLIYVAVLNIPVILLGLRKSWQLLYNLSFVATVLYTFQWLDLMGSNDLWVSLGFMTLYFLEYAGLGLLKLRSETEVRNRPLDMLRLFLSSGILLFSVYVTLQRGNMEGWIGFWFLGYAALHVAFAYLGTHVFSAFKNEILTFLAGTVLFAGLALPAQLDGAWVSLGWAIEGLIVAWLATRIRSNVFVGIAFILGLIGILKTICYDVSLYDDSPQAFWNVRIWVGIFSAMSLALQGWILRRRDLDFVKPAWLDLLWWVTIVAILFVGVSDLLWTLDIEKEIAWMSVGWFIFMLGIGIFFCVPRDYSVCYFGSVLLLTLPIYILIVGLIFRWDVLSLESFRREWFWLEMGSLAMIWVGAYWLVTFGNQKTVFPVNVYAVFLNVLSIAVVVCLLSAELFIASSHWGSMGVTLLWGGSGLLLTLYGLGRQLQVYRLYGLLFVSIAIFKILFFDSAALDGLQRIVAFIGTGILLLILSFVYQLASGFFKSTANNESASSENS